MPLILAGIKIKICLECADKHNLLEVKYACRDGASDPESVNHGSDHSRKLFPVVPCLLHQFRAL